MKPTAPLDFRRVSKLDPATATVAVVMPARNEERHIAGALETVLRQTFDPCRMEIVVVDGLSTDGTVAAATRLLKGRARGRVMSNPAVTIPSGMNAGIAATRSDVVVRVDGHCRLRNDYVEQCVRLLAETGAANVGGLMRPRGEGAVGRAMALALCSRFGIGDSSFHFSERETFVETVYMGAFRRTVLEEVGGYDENILANEDFELNHRIRAAAYSILLSPDVVSHYLPRDSIAAVSRQFFRYGRWKSQVMRKHRGSIRPRHLVAPALVAVLGVTLPAFVLTRRSWLLAPVRLYALAVAVAALLTARPKFLAGALCAVFPAMHLSWGSGVLFGLLRGTPGERARGGPSAG